MLNKMLTPIFIILSLMLMPLAAHATETKTVTLDVEKMTCQFCPITIRKALEKVPGVTKAKASFDTRTATITFHPAKTNVEALIKATTNAGYPSKLKK